MAAIHHGWMCAIVAAVMLMCPLAGVMGLTASEHVEKAKKALAGADFGQALEQYHSACDLAPEDYKNYYGRATVYLATGRTRHALKDLTHVLDLKPDLEAARKRRAELFLKDGSYSDAAADFNTLGMAEQAAEAQKGQAYSNAGKEHLDAGNAANALQYLNTAIDISPNAVSLRAMRAKAFQLLGKAGDAVGDAMRAAQLSVGDADAYFLLSQLQFETGDRVEALKSIRECIKLDADHKEGFKLYRKLKKFAKIMDALEKNIAEKRWAEALTAIPKAREVEDKEKHFVNDYNVWECEALVNLQRHQDAKTKCDEALAYHAEAGVSGKRGDLYLLRATVHENMEEYEESVAACVKAIETDENNDRFKKAKERAERLLKQSKKRDYYKILGLPRDCRKPEINKAYRKMAAEWHPDKFHTEEEKEKATKKFMDIADAKEVLSDKDKRQIFDDGQDPLDAEAERDRTSRHSSFFNGFNQGGGGQHFHFRHG